MTAAIGLATVASAQPQAQSLATVVTADEPTPTPPIAVENLTHPNGDALAGNGIRLKRGDGRIVLTECTSSYDIWIDTRAILRGICFNVTSTSGYLELEVPDAINIATGNHSLKASLTTNGTEKTVVVPKNGWQPVGEGDNNTGNKPAVLVELRVTG
ncbi:hypothetical protein [Streptomyces sp. CB02980]|uniref:hypothetical protein n=1 Tax=Streptomyces sp. CB02980 TaxID=2542736 RepID=UPI001E30CDD3|nr:hypothetical protein [Streptomyces sp. CB02980]